MADLIITEEPWTYELASEMEALVRDFFAKSQAGSNRPPLDYNWPYYKMLTDVGMFVVYTARENGILRGFSMYTMPYHPHHQTVRYGFCELLGVPVEERGRGIGRKLVEFAERDLADKGCSRMIQGDRHYHGKKSLFEKMDGYVLVESYYQKVIGPDPAPSYEVSSSTP